MITSTNQLFHSDCLALLERMPSESVALAYLDPPWYPEVPHDETSLRQHMLFLSHVVQQAQRVLWNHGSLYFYSTPSLAGYIRPILDQIMEQKNFRREIIWPRRVRGARHAHHDTIYLYSKTEHYTFYPPTRPLTRTEQLASFSYSDQSRPYRYRDLTVSSEKQGYRFEWNGFSPPMGRSWRFNKKRMDEMQARAEIDISPTGGMPRAKEYMDGDSEPLVEVGSIWSDIPSLSGRARENIGYTTQQPLSLLSRIISMASNEGDVVLDPFCGSGTTLVAAQKLGRRWIGCDSDKEAINIAIRRLHELLNVEMSSFDQEQLEKNYPVIDRSYKRIFTGFDVSDREIAERFVIDHVVPIEETRHYEFKQVIGPNPVNIIKNTADEYVVAFLNSEGGRIFWGIRDDRTVVGVSLDSRQRDELKRHINSKLSEIRPAIDPTQYHIYLHNVYMDSRKISDLHVVEITVPRVYTSAPYCTGGQEVFVKTDSGKRKLTVAEIVDWVRNRMAT